MASLSIPSVLEKAFSDPFCLYERLAEYYEEKGYFINNPAGIPLSGASGFCRFSGARKGGAVQAASDFGYVSEENMTRPAFALPLLENQEMAKENK